jgi:hypothetical protein
MSHACPLACRERMNEEVLKGKRAEVIHESNGGNGAFASASVTCLYRPIAETFTRNVWTGLQSTLTPRNSFLSFILFSTIYDSRYLQPYCF